MKEEIKQENIKKVSKHDFYFETPLYELLEYSEIDSINNLLTDDVDAYSSRNKTDTTYRIKYEWVVYTENKYINQFET